MSALLCARCGEQVAPPPDPDQLQLLFKDLEPRRVSRIDSPTLEERYWSLRAKATQATRRRYPYC